MGGQAKGPKVPGLLDEHIDARRDLRRRRREQREKSVEETLLALP
jgi:hypothetical protein